MDKYDIKTAHKALYAPRATDFVVVDVPEIHYIAIDGHGDPNTSTEYSDAIEALYATAYTLKFESKSALQRDFVVGPLEGLWRAADMGTFVTRNKDAWEWTMMIAQPEWITAEAVTAALEKVVSKKKELPSLGLLRFMALQEGASVQILHIGSYDDEAPLLERLHNSYLPDNNLDFNGDHHEIYLSDARRTAPEKLKTVLRQPVKRR